MKLSRVAPCLFVLACQPGPDSSSETHFIVCARDWECTELGTEFACVDGSCQKVPGGPVAPITPGQCSGAQTICDVPQPAELTIPESTSCTVTEGTVAVAWESELGTVECPLGECVAAYPTKLTASADGGVAAVVDLMAPGHAESVGRVGIGLVRFDSAGTRTSSVMLWYVTRLTTNQRGGDPAGLAVDEERLRLMLKSSAPSPFSGYDLEQRRADGALITAHRLIDGAGTATALFDAAGAFVNYSYADEGDPRAEPTNLVRVGNDGRLVWQQTGLVSAAPLARDPATGGVWMNHPVSATDPHRAIALVDADGNVARNLAVFPDTEDVGIALQPASADTVFAWFYAQYPPPPGEAGGSVRVPLVLLDSTGSARWAVDLAASDPSNASNLINYSLLPSFNGQAVLASGMNFALVSNDGTRCAIHTAKLEHCLAEGGDPPLCAITGYSAPSGAYFVGMPRGIAKVTFGGLQ